LKYQKLKLLILDHHYLQHFLVQVRKLIQNRRHLHHLYHFLMVVQDHQDFLVMEMLAEYFQNQLMLGNYFHYHHLILQDCQE